MNKGDLAFFYHSSCKVPAIVGISTLTFSSSQQSYILFPKPIPVLSPWPSPRWLLQNPVEIVSSHTPDLTAHNPSAPYHDPTSKPDNPKWSVVHVEFRQKLTTPVTLKEMREFNELKEMQMLKLTRLSVSKVREEEWKFLVGEMGKRGDIVDLWGRVGMVRERFVLLAGGYD